MNLCMILLIQRVLNLNVQCLLQAGQVQLEEDKILDNVPVRTTDSPIISQQKLKTTGITDKFENDNSAEKESSRLRKVRIRSKR